MSN
ncbi:BgTH12-06801 [Blumeria graminis f. sp. triticale]|jgi:hypothetical protein